MYTVQSKNLFDSNLKINRQLDIGGKYIDFCILQLLEDKYTYIYKQFQLETVQFKITNMNMDTQIYISILIDRKTQIDRKKQIDRKTQIDRKRIEGQVI